MLKYKQKKDEEGYKDLKSTPTSLHTALIDVDFFLQVFSL